MIVIPLLMLAVGASAKGSYLPYKERMAQIDANLGRISSPLARGQAIMNDLREWNKSERRLSDVDLFGIIYKQIYRTYFLCFFPGKEEYYWDHRMSKEVSILQQSVEKDVCLAFLDQNMDGWMFDKFSKWQESPLLACVLTRRSTGWCHDAKRLQLYTSAYNLGYKLKSRSAILAESMDVLLSKARFLATKDEKYIRSYIDQTRVYVSHTPDPLAHKAVLDDVDWIEQLHFKKKKGN